MHARFGEVLKVVSAVSIKTIARSVEPVGR